MAKQASDTLKTISRKNSDYNLNTSHRDETEVYEQNPRVYLYQQQLQKNIPTRPQRRPQPDDDLSGDWIMNNQILQSEPRQIIEYHEAHSTSDRLRRNMSLPDLNSEYTKSTREHRSSSPEDQLPGQDTNRSRRRPKVNPHHFIASDDSMQVSAINDDNPDRSAHPTPPQRSSSRTIRTRAIKPRNSQQDQTEQRKQFTTKHQVLSDESLPEYMETLTLSSNKDLPPIPSKPPPPALPSASDALKMTGGCGLIPQDVLKNMDSKDVKAAIKATVIASRVYRVMTPEQIEILKKEQEELNEFIETMNVSLQIECRMRDASHSLIRLHENNSNLESVKDSTTQLQATSRRMDRIFQQTQEAMQRLLTIQRYLLQHEGAILNAGLRRLDCENRELSRTVMQLDNARGLEKEEKIKWKKEHNRLKFQSVLFPSTPVAESFADNAIPSMDLQLVQQQHQAQLASMETYVKELNDEILHKDETITDLGNQLQAVKGWAKDFQSSVQSRKAVHEENEQPESNEPLEKKLQQLQSDVEYELKEMDVQNLDLKQKVESLLEENSALVGNSKALLATNENSHVEPRFQPRRDYRIKSHSRQGSDLRMVLQESLLELDRQIQQEEGQCPSLSRSSSTSSSATACSFDSHENNEPRLFRSSSDRRGSGKSSRVNSSGSQSSLGLREQVLTRGFHFEEVVLSNSDDDTVIEDPTVEIERSGTIVKGFEVVEEQQSSVMESI
ncbi:hypothetical protein BGZ49_002601 [Haplosporangium sp. Z 27]|nr:hypothetical protein BGZ49_002601 [Haplosporangium sp. Z 27]